MDRALREFRIRGVSTNIAFVENLLKHPTFLNYQYTTKFIDETPELFDFTPKRDRATRILTYVADITVNGHPETEGRPEPKPDLRPARAPGAELEVERANPNALAIGDLVVFEPEGGTELVCHRVVNIRREGVKVILHEKGDGSWAVGRVDAARPFG